METASVYALAALLSLLCSFNAVLAGTGAGECIEVSGLGNHQLNGQWTPTGDNGYEDKLNGYVAYTRNCNFLLAKRVNTGVEEVAWTITDNTETFGDSQECKQDPALETVDVTKCTEWREGEFRVHGVKFVASQCSADVDGEEEPTECIGADGIRNPLWNGQWTKEKCQVNGYDAYAKDGYFLYIAKEYEHNRRWAFYWTISNLKGTISEGNTNACRQVPSLGQDVAITECREWLEDDHEISAVEFGAKSQCSADVAQSPSPTGAPTQPPKFEVALKLNSDFDDLQEKLKKNGNIPIKTWARKIVEKTVNDSNVVVRILNVSRGSVVISSELELLNGSNSSVEELGAAVTTIKTTKNMVDEDGISYDVADVVVTQLTNAPTSAPTQLPTGSPTQLLASGASTQSQSTDAPTRSPTDAPTEAPTDASTDAPTQSPTDAPTGAPTQTPTHSPTDAPTGSPTGAPTDAPTDAPTQTPTAAPTQTCNGTTDIKHVNWMELSRDESLAPYANVTMEHVPADLVLLINVELEYVGDSYGSRLEQRGYGTTYVLDFESLNAHDSTSSPLSAPGTCSNRKASNKTFDEMWNYSLSPNLPGGIGSSNTNLAYPEPSDYWTVEMKNGSECTRIVYKGKFDLNELRECADGLNNSKKFLHFVDVHEWMNISGTFYVNLVSPMNKDTDTGYHYVYQLVSAPFVMAIKKNVYFVSSTGISLFAMTFVAVYKDTDETKYTLMLLTESNDHLQLSIRRLLTSPDDSGVQIDNNDSESGCLVGRNNMCMQLFKVSAPNVDCANDRFSGQYGIRFDIACVATLATNSAGFKHCTDWLAAETEENGPNGDDTVDLFIDLEFTDDICDAQIFVIKFNAEMSFYKDADFTANQTDTRNGYAVGVDHIYVSVKLNFSEKAFSIIKTRLINVWLCTINESIYSIDAVSQTGATSGGGCHSHNIAQVYHIVEDTDAQIATGYEDYNIVIYDRTADSFHENEVRVSFKVPKDVEYGKLYVHVHIKIGLLADTITARRRRRLLAEIEPAKADQMRHFMDSTDIRQDIASDGGQTEEGVMSSDNKHTTQHYLIGVMLALVMIFE